jgi:hypothetical protein
MTYLYNILTENVDYVDFDVIKIYIRDPVDNGTILRNNSRDMLFLWCKENCQGRFWIGMGFGQFEFNEDSIIFKLRWA